MTKLSKKWIIGIAIAVFIIVVIAIVLLVVLLPKIIKHTKPDQLHAGPGPAVVVSLPTTKQHPKEILVPVRAQHVPTGMVRTTVSNDPIVDLITDFLTPDECDELVALADPKLKRSNVVCPTTGEYVPNPARTSESMYFEKGETPLIARIEAKAAAMANLPVEFLEGMQVVRYQHGQFYNHHFDYFPVDNKEIKTRGQRILTLFGYLNTLPQEETGGGTDFPSLKHTFKPLKGSAALWHNVDSKGVVDPRVLHAGQTINTPGAVKYGLNMWFRSQKW
jgi:prolyl 4-hydroxylase